MVAPILTLPTAVSYALISREIPSAGSGYTWLSESVSPLVGIWTGLVLVATYFFSVILQPPVFGLFLNELWIALLAWQPCYGVWLIGVLISTLAVALLAYPGIDISAKSSITLTVVEMVVVLALAGTILLVCFHQGRVEYQPFNPAASLRGFEGFSKGLVFALLSFGGFSVITTAAEETHAPRSIIPRAVVMACVLLGIFWAFTSWGFSLVLPAEAAMGRDGTLPAFFGRLHPKYKVPWNVTLVVAAIWGRWLGLYRSYEWWGTVVVFFAMLSNILVNIGCSVFFYRFRRQDFNWWWHAFIPCLGVVTSGLPLYYSFGASLWNAGWQSGQSIIIFCLFTVLVSGLYTVALGLLRPRPCRAKSPTNSPQ